jgi:hypothetical protein
VLCIANVNMIFQENEHQRDALPRLAEQLLRQERRVPLLSFTPCSSVGPVAESAQEHWT